MSAFERFYEAYPRKKSKATAERAFEKAVREHFAGDEEKALATMLDALNRLAPEWDTRPPDKVPYPATWLNARGWLDALDCESPPVKPKEPACKRCKLPANFHGPNSPAEREFGCKEFQACL